MKTLCEILTSYDSDKNTVHSYGPIYDGLLAPIRETATRILEIGVHRGGSLRAWRDYFPKAHVYGVDIDDSCMFKEERITTFVGNQANEAELAAIAKQYGPFDVVVDDGSHVPRHQVASLFYLWPYLAPTGFYFIEDIPHERWIEWFCTLPNAAIYDCRNVKGRFDDILFLARKRPLNPVART